MCFEIQIDFIDGFREALLLRYFLLRKDRGFIRIVLHYDPGVFLRILVIVHDLFHKNRRDSLERCELDDLLTGVRIFLRPGHMV